MGLLRATTFALVLWIPIHGSDVSERCKALDRELPALRELSSIPGFSVAVAGREGVVWSAAYGVRDQSSQAAVNEETVFEAASLSKPVFAYAVLQLVEAGMLDLDRPLASYGPYADLAHDEREARLTARMALTHTTGLPNWRPRGQALEFEYEPGERWRYSGEGFVMLQRTVERLTGDTLEEVARSLVFEPLGMTRSSYVWRERFADNVAVPHDEQGVAGEMRHLTEPNAAYSLLTTAPDYARFVAGVLRAQNLEDATFAQMLQPQADVNTGVTWGLGWGLEQHDDGQAFWHWGHNSGYRAYVIAYPAREFALVYLSNSDNGMQALRDLVNLASGEEGHPAVAHLDYESHDAPRLMVPRLIEAVVLELGVEEGIAAYFELKEEYPAEAFPEPMLDQLAGRFWNVLEREDDALALYRLNADVFGTSSTASLHLGIALMSAGHKDEALEALEMALALDPSNEEVRGKIEELAGAK